MTPAEQMNPYFGPVQQLPLIKAMAAIQNDVDFNYLCHITGIRPSTVEDYQRFAYGDVQPRIHDQGPNPFGFPVGNVTPSPVFSERLTPDQVERINQAGPDHAAVQAILREQIVR